MSLKLGKFNINFTRESIYILVILVFCFMFIQQCNSRKNQEAALDRMNNNIASLLDTVTVLKNKQGETLYSISTLAATKDELKTLNKELYDELKSVKSQVIYANKVIATIGKGDIPHVINSDIKEIIPRKKYEIAWSNNKTYDSSNYQKLEGVTTVVIDSSGIQSHFTTLNTNELGFSLSTYLVEEKGKIRTIIKPKFPGLVINDIDGALLDPHKSEVIKGFFKPKKWSVGPNVSIGLGKDLKPQVFVGLGIQYTIFSF